MEEDNLKKFELNNSVLRDFDTIMSLRLDFVKELVVTEVDSEYKLLNIVGLCTTLKTLEIQNNQRINTDNVISSIRKPELLENLILNDVKLPSESSLRKLTNLKTILLTNIRFAHVEKLLSQITDPDKITEVSLCDMDYGKGSLNVLKRFENLQFVNLDNINNCRWDKMEFALENVNLQKLDIKNCEIDLAGVSNLAKTPFIKNVSIKTDTGDIVEMKKGGTTITVNTSNLEMLTREVELENIDDVNIIIDIKNNIKQYTKKLRRLKGGITITAKDISWLSTKSIRHLSDRLLIKRVYLGEDEKTKKPYNLESYLSIRKGIDSIIAKTEKTDIQKFCDIYKALRETIKIDNSLGMATLEASLKKKRCTSIMYAKVVQHCLECLKLESKIIKGYVKEKPHLWNQVKISDKWYNVDIATDILDNRVFDGNSKNCLIEDKVFYKTHKLKDKDVEESPESFNKDLIPEEIKVEVKKVSALQRAFKILFGGNKQKALPDGEEQK